MTEQTPAAVPPDPADSASDNRPEGQGASETAQALSEPRASVADGLDALIDEHGEGGVLNRANADELRQAEGQVAESKSKGPARGYSWPPFEPGNTSSLKHGAYSPRQIAPIAAQLVEAVVNDPDLPHLSRPAFRPAVEAWAAIEAKVRLIADWCDRLSIEESATVKGEPLNQLRHWENAAAKHRARLGLDPVSAGRLAKDVAIGRAVDTARLMAELHRMEQRQNEQTREGDQ